MNMNIGQAADVSGDSTNTDIEFPTSSENLNQTVLGSYKINLTCLEYWFLYQNKNIRDSIQKIRRRRHSI